MATLAELIGSSTYSGLCDSFEDKRLNTATDFENFVHRKQREAHESSSWWLKECIRAISNELITSNVIHHRAGGILALTSIVLGMKDDYLDEVLGSALKICLKLFDDPEARVRYYACEGVFNILKVVRGRCLPYFTYVFDGLCKLTTDPDHENRHITPIMDRILKEIITENYPSSLPNVLSVIEAHLVYPNPFVKQVCIGWISLLRKLGPSLVANRLAYILPSLLSQLSGDNTVGRRDLAVQAFALLDSFLVDIAGSELVLEEPAMRQVVNVLIKYSNFQDSLSTRARVVIFTWMRQFVLLMNDTPPPQVEEIVTVALSTMAQEPPGSQVHAAVVSLNETCLHSRAILHILRESQIFQKLLPKSPLAVLAWIEATGNVVPLDVLAIGLFGETAVVAPTVALLVGHFSDKAIAEALAKMCVNKSDEQIAHVLGKFAQTRLMFEMHSDQPKIVRATLVCLFSNEFAASRAELGKTPKFVDSLADRWTPICPFSAFTLCVFGNRFERAMQLLETAKPTENQLNEFALFFETEAFTNHRLSLVDTKGGTKLAQCLLKVTMLMNQESVGFKLIMNRLQLVNIFKLL